MKVLKKHPTLKVLLKVLSNATNRSKEADEVDGRIGEDGQVLPQLEDADGDKIRSISIGTGDKL